MTPEFVDGDGRLGGGSDIVVDVKGSGIVVAIALTAAGVAGGGAKVGNVVPGHLTVGDGDVRGETGAHGGTAIVGEQGVVDGRGRTGGAENVIGADVMNEANRHVFEGPGGAAEHAVIHALFNEQVLQGH